MPNEPMAPKSADQWRTFGQGYLPGLMGIEFRDVARGRVTSRLAIRTEHLAPNGYLHAATVVAVADSSCGYGTIASLPDGASGFTTIELKANFLGTVLDGAIACEATLVHARTHHPGLGRDGHRRGHGPRDRPLPLHPDPALSALTGGVRAPRVSRWRRRARPRARSGGPSRRRPA